MVWMLATLLACQAPPAPTPPIASAPLPVAAPTAAPTPAPTPSGPVVCGLGDPVRSEHDGDLRALAVRVGLEHPDAFVSVANHLHQRGTLPDCYRSKRDAGDLGWQRGSDLWRSQPGAAIGGDHFGNYEGLLPDRGRYREADLDYDGGRRGAHRLVFDRDVRGSWKMWVTVDHYDSFTEVTP